MVGWLVGCLTSQQHAGVSQGRELVEWRKLEGMDKSGEHFIFMDGKVSGNNR